MVFMFFVFVENHSERGQPVVCGGTAMLKAAVKPLARPSHPGRLGVVPGSDPALANGPCLEWAELT